LARSEGAGDVLGARPVFSSESGTLKAVKLGRAKPRGGMRWGLAAVVLLGLGLAGGAASVALGLVPLGAPPPLVVQAPPVSRRPPARSPSRRPSPPSRQRRSS